MKRQLIILALVIFSINLVIGAEICIDNSPPTWSENVSFTLNFVDGNMHLSWTPAEDEPECSGISHYLIVRNDFHIANTTEPSYTDIGLGPGTYSYVIYAVDLVGHNEGVGISASINIPAPPTHTGSGGGGASMLSFWDCEEWGECSDERIQTRTCVDSRDLEADRIETRTCIPAFTPTTTDIAVPKPISIVTTEETPQGFLGRTTGAVIGALETPEGTLVIIVFVLAVLSGVVVVAVKTRKEK